MVLVIIFFIWSIAVQLEKEKIKINQFWIKNNLIQYFHNLICKKFFISNFFSRLRPSLIKQKDRKSKKKKRRNEWQKNNSIMTLERLLASTIVDASSCSRCPSIWHAWRNKRSFTGHKKTISLHVVIADLGGRKKADLALVLQGELGPRFLQHLTFHRERARWPRKGVRWKTLPK